MWRSFPSAPFALKEGTAPTPNDRASLRPIAVSVIAALAFFSSAAKSAEITCLKPVAAPFFELTDHALEVVKSGRRPHGKTCYVLLIKGEIVKGDSVKFAEALRLSHPFLDGVALWSQGGSIEEALRIGHLLRAAVLQTDAPRSIDTRSPLLRGSTLAVLEEHVCSGKDCYCASACFFIWAAGAKRNGNALGLHRPSTKSTSFSNLPPDEASRRYQALLSAMTKYLEEMEVPRQVVDLITQTSSNDVRWLTYEQANSMSRPPSIAEWLSSSCGALNENEMRLLLEADPKNAAYVKALNERLTGIWRCEWKKVLGGRDAKMF